MTLGCDPCGCIGGNISSPLYYQYSLEVLCKILLAVGGSTGLTEVDPVLGTLAFGSVTTAAFTTLVTPTGTGAILDVTNKLDVDVYLSLDGTNNDVFVAAGTYKIIDLRAADRKLTTAVKVKAIGSNATSGNIYGTIYQ
jgi:hypothetical protein